MELDCPQSRGQTPWCVWEEYGKGGVDTRGSRRRAGKVGSSIIGCSELANQQPIIPQVTWGRGLAKTQLWILLPVSALFICITWGPVRGGTERVVSWMNDTKNKSPQSYVRVWCYKNIVNKKITPFL